MLIHRFTELIGHNVRNKAKKGSLKGGTNCRAPQQPFEHSDDRVDGCKHCEKHDTLHR